MPIQYVKHVVGCACDERGRDPDCYVIQRRPVEDIALEAYAQCMSIGTHIDLDSPEGRDECVAVFSRFLRAERETP